MKREEIENIVKTFLVEEIEVDETAIAPDARLKEDLAIDSLDFVDIVVIVERDFGFKIKAEEMTGVRTLGDFCDYIESKVKQGKE
ncbi:MAG: phosphopantetheine-binding protein [Odoribacteraceae bacterium]|jgi:acyl carrier protein|nr:phosphopantetheine-binding protein [Odoribacteraceae bacterium]